MNGTTPLPPPPAPAAAAGDAKGSDGRRSIDSVGEVGVSMCSIGRPFGFAVLEELPPPTLL